ncbi:MAG: GH116 family glycosyl-hydrolase [Thermoguttaceae bacterium]
MNRRTRSAVAARSRPGVLIGIAVLLAIDAQGASPAVKTDAQAYRQKIAAEPDLVAYWPFDGSLRPARGSADAQSPAGQAQFTRGPGAGKALRLGQGRYVTMGSTPELDLPEITVELWFRLDFEPGVGYNPCILAKRADGDHTQTRFSLHALSNYAALAVWNGRAVTTFHAGDGPLQRGRWYHLALTCTATQMRMFLNGVPCEPDGPAQLFQFDKKNLPLSVGSSQPKGAELLDGAVAELAFYGRALGDEQIAFHVDAMGFQKDRLAMAQAREARIQKEAALRAEQESRREARRRAIFADPGLMVRDRPTTVYQGDHLEAISFPVGGIGTGSIQINGRAERHVWQIFNNHRHAVVPNSFLAVCVKPVGGKPVLRGLQTTPVGPIPGMKGLVFQGAYPLGLYRFEDPELAARIFMEVYNPLVPLETISSAIPCAVFELRAANSAEEPVEVTFLATQQNAVGYLGDRPIQGRAYPGYGGNRNRIERRTRSTLLHMTAQRPQDAQGSGDMVLAALAQGASGTALWQSVEELANGLSGAEALPELLQAGPSPAGQTIDGAVWVTFRLEPGQARTIPFVLTWHFPNVQHGTPQWNARGNMYANWWPDARAVAVDLESGLEELAAKTRRYRDLLYQTNLPCWLLDRISSQVAVLRSQTCFWGKDGYFGAWEGCSTGGGCCHGNCNHVWHYAQAHARLFPEIARRMRQQEFRYQGADGAIPHRQFVSFPATDGQCGAVLNSYREHLISPDRKWLDAHWPSIRRAMDYTIARWDKDEDGVLAGAQWNTLDGALGGSTSWLGTLYLAALAAAEKMALLENDTQAAQRYGRIRASGARTQDQTLFNGEYYIQIPDPEPREDYATGCAIDQVLGQWWAHQLDLGWLYPAEHVRTALSSLFRYNFRGTMEGLKQVPRKFVADEDPGTQMITWPKGPRPAKCILYGDEVMTGFEYAAAAAMIQSGLLKEGFAMVRAVSIRYDGRLRTGLTPGDTSSWGYSGNPFGDDECGKFYARAMSSWSLLLACQGFVYDGPAGLIGFRPVWRPEEHTSFFTAAEGWGLFKQQRSPPGQIDTIEVHYGRLRLATLVLQVPEGVRVRAISVTAGEQPVAARFAARQNEVRVTLDQAVVLKRGQRLVTTIAWGGN